MTAAAIELNAETDFVARNELFQAAARAIAKAALDVHGGVEALRAAKLPSGETVGRADHRPHRHHRREHGRAPHRPASASSRAPSASTSTTRSRARPTSAASACWWPIEGAGDQARLAGARQQHRPARAPATRRCRCRPDDLDPAAVEKEKAILTEQALESGKPANVVEKMVEGRIRKWMEEVVLLKQAL